MPLFPRIASPCPYTSNLDEVVAGDWCRMCERKVVDITDMSDQEKKALFSDCSDTPCVRYTLPLAAAVAVSLAVGAAAAATPTEQPRTQSHPGIVVPRPIPMHTAGLPAMPPRWEHHDAPATGTTPAPASNGRSAKTQ